MTKKFLLLTCALFTLLSVQAQEAPEVQKSMISKITATWCPPCGGWGWGFFHDLEEDNNANALAVAVHHSGDLETATSSAIADNFNTNSQPKFLFNNADQGVVPSNSADKRSDIQSMVDANAATAPVVNTGLQAFHDMDNNTITVKTNSKFFQEANGEYYLGLYVVENDVANYQATVGNGAIHTNVLRTGLSTNHFGEELANGTIAAGTETALEFSIEIDSDWNMENVTMASIIWKLENGSYTFVNTNSTNTFEEPINTTSVFSNNTLANWEMKILPTISNGEAVVSIDAPSQLANFDLVVFNHIGQAVTTLHAGSLAAGQHTFEFESTLPKGVYMVRSSSEDMIGTKRMIIQ